MDVPRVSNRNISNENIWTDKSIYYNQKVNDLPSPTNVNKSDNSSPSSTKQKTKVYG